MLKRRIEKNIENWIKNNNKALLLCGVRQCGKTFVIRKCLDKTKSNYVEFNLIEQPQIASIINNATNTDDLILKLSLYSKDKLIPNNTIIFLDEIQVCKEAITKIKFLVDDSRFKFVLSGSLLGVEITDLRSTPVGYLEILEMYPLDFDEFLQIFNVDIKIKKILFNSFSLLKPVDAELHAKLIDIFNLYLIIGGMPAAVDIYKNTSNIDDVIKIHKDIANLYKIDFSQYEMQSKKLLLSHIYDLIPAELNEKNKRFNIADINKNLRYNRVVDSFTWLWKSGVALSAFNVTEPLVPLLLNEKSSLFKLFLSDVGLLTTMYGKSSKLKIVSGEASINKGAIFENYVAQELNSHGFPLYYYNSKKNGEIDFVIEKDMNVLPIEVKSGKNYARHSALTNILQSKEYNINKAVVFSRENVMQNDDIVYYPIYMTMFLHNNPEDFCDISLDKYKF